MNALFEQPSDVASNEPPLRRVVGLRYAPDAGLPQVILKGSGPLADELLKRRGARGPRVVRDEALLESLYKLPLDAQIGPELFHVVAVILAHVFALDAQLRSDRSERRS